MTMTMKEDGGENENKMLYLVRTYNGPNTSIVIFTTSLYSR